MKLKKLLAMLLALAMVFAFAACQKDDDKKDDDKDSKTKAEDTVKEDKKEDKKEEKEAEPAKEKAPDIDELAWDGYPDMPLIEYLETGVNAMAGDMGIEVDVSAKEGWNTTELDASDYEYVYTYSIKMSFEGEEMNVDLFMALEDGLLVAKGGLHGDAETMEFGSAEEAVETLEELLEYV